MRTARARTSGENLFDFFMAPSSQRLEPPQIPGRFNPAYRLEAVAAHNELRAQNAPAAARDAAIAAQWEFHNLMLGVKDQVIAQYGADSDQVASLGLKKKSERKARVRAGKNST